MINIDTDVGVSVLLHIDPSREATLINIDTDVFGPGSHRYQCRSMCFRSVAMSVSMCFWSVRMSLNLPLVDVDRCCHVAKPSFGPKLVFSQRGDIVLARGATLINIDTDVSAPCFTSVSMSINVGSAGINIDTDVSVALYIETARQQH